MLTVYGIETVPPCEYLDMIPKSLQQCLPFTVLKHINLEFFSTECIIVATVLIVYDIETKS